MLPASQTLQSPATDSSAAREVKPQRSLLIDIVRGLSISLVVLGHTNQGLIHRGRWGTSVTGLRLDTFIYAFHMPAFFFVSGIFLCASAEKRGGWRFTIEKLRTILYPYLLLAFVFAPVALLSRFSNSSAANWRVYVESVATGGFSWFLPTIFFVVVLGMLLRRVPMPLLFVLSTIVSLYWPQTGLVFVDRGLEHLPFLVAGMWMGRSFEQMERVPKIIAAAAAAALFVSIAVLTEGRYAGSRYLFLPLGLLGTLMLMLASHCLSRSAPARLLAWAGAGSLSIFLLSPLFQWGGRQIVSRLLPATAPYPQLLIPTALAILLPAWIYHKRIRLHLGWIFLWPF